MAQENTHTNCDLSKRLRTLIVFERNTTCRLWRAFLSSISQLEVLDAQIDNLNLLEEVARLKPELVLLDWKVLKENSAEILYQIKHILEPQKITCIVLVSTSSQRSKVQGADRIMVLSTEPSQKLQDYIDLLLSAE